MEKKIRIYMGISAAVLFGAEVLIALFAHGWVRGSFGDILVMMLLYALWRTVFPSKPAHGMLLPAALLIFSFCVEFLQLWGFADKMHITNRVLRIIIGTGFSAGDLLCYTVGILPCLLPEFYLRKKAKS